MEAQGKGWQALMHEIRRLEVENQARSILGGITEDQVARPRGEVAGDLAGLDRGNLKQMLPKRP